MLYKRPIPANQAVQRRETLQTIVGTLHACEFRRVKIKTSNTSSTVEIGHIVIVSDNEGKIGRYEYTSITIPQTSVTLSSIYKIT
jgi:hypothetical protein